MADLKSTFLNVYSVLKKELLEDPAFEWSPDSRDWVERHHVVPFVLYLRCSKYCFGKSLRIITRPDDPESNPNSTIE